MHMIRELSDWLPNNCGLVIEERKKERKKNYIMVQGNPTVLYVLDF